MSPQPASRFLRGALLLHLDPVRVERADIRVKDGIIVDVGPGLRPQPGDEIMDLSGHWIFPGLVCGHHHLYSALAGGMPLPASEPPTFADMLAQVWWKLDRALDPESVEVSGLVGGLGALRAGVTTIVDHHASPNFIGGSLECLDGALARIGQRRVLCYEVTDRGGPDEAAAGLAAHEKLLARPKDGWSAVLVGAHANFTCSDATLAACGELARAHGTGVHIHVAEAVDDETSVGEPLVARMARLGALVPGSLLAHCVYLKPQELAQIYEAGAWTSHQARSNMNNHVGYAPVADFGSKTILGTDGIGADMFTEMQIGYFKAREAGIPWWPSRFLQALTAGAEFAGQHLGARIGRIEKGWAADLVVADVQPGPPLSEGNLAGAFIFRFGSNLVRHVMVGGDWKLWNRDPVDLDTLALDERARKAAVAVWKRMSA